MKKILLSFLVIFLLAGCGNSQLRDLEGNEKSNYKIGETANQGIKPNTKRHNTPCK